MSVTPLFRLPNRNNGDDENRLWLSMDEPESKEERRAILNLCAVDNSLREKRDIFQQSLDLGEKLPWSAPDPSLRASLLEKAYEATLRPQTAPLASATASAPHLRLPRWKWVWAALFLVLSWGILEQFRDASNNVPRIEQLDMEMLTLQREINQLKMDIIEEFDFDPGESA